MWKAFHLAILSEKMNFGDAWGKLSAENCVERQSRTEYMRKTLVLMWNNALRESFDLFSASIAKSFDWGGILDTNL